MKQPANKIRSYFIFYLILATLFLTMACTRQIIDPYQHRRADDLVIELSALPTNTIIKRLSKDSWLIEAQSFPLSLNMGCNYGRKLKTLANFQTSGEINNLNSSYYSFIESQTIKKDRVISKHYRLDLPFLHSATPLEAECILNRLDKSGQSTVVAARRFTLHIRYIFSPAWQGKTLNILCAGQSNMTGTVPLPAKPEYDPQDRIMVLDNCYQWRLARQPIDNGVCQIQDREQIQPDEVLYEPFQGYQLCLPLALRLLKQNPNLKIGLIPAAKSGSSIVEWGPDYQTKYEMNLFQATFNRLQIARQMGPLAAVVFFQGETDALSKDGKFGGKKADPDNWDGRFVEIINRLKYQTGQVDFITIVVQIGKYPEAKEENMDKEMSGEMNLANWDLVKQKQIAAVGKLTFADIVFTDRTQPHQYHDGLHLTVDSYRALSYNIADSFWKKFRYHRLYYQVR